MNKTITQEKIEEAAKKYAAEVDKNVRDLYGIEEQPASLTFGECAAESFREGVNFALGKQEKEGIDLKKLDKMLDDALKKETKESLNQWLSKKVSDTVIQGWVCRDENGCLCLYQNEPKREAYDFSPRGYWTDGTNQYIDFPLNLFPDLTWNSDPLQVELIIKRKKK